MITFDGSMILCCEDYYANYVYGNILTEGFLTLWRRSLPQQHEIFLGNYIKPICRVCVGLDSPSPPQQPPQAPPDTASDVGGRRIDAFRY